MSHHRIKFRLPLFGEAEAEGLIGIAALVIVVLVTTVILRWPLHPRSVDSAPRDTAASQSSHAHDVTDKNKSRPGDRDDKEENALR